MSIDKKEGKDETEPVPPFVFEETDYTRNVLLKRYCLEEALGLWGGRYQEPQRATSDPRIIHLFDAAFISVFLLDHYVWKVITEHVNPMLAQSVIRVCWYLKFLFKGHTFKPDDGKPCGEVVVPLLQVACREAGRSRWWYTVKYVVQNELSDYIDYLLEVLYRNDIDKMCNLPVDVDKVIKNKKGMLALLSATFRISPEGMERMIRDGDATTIFFQGLSFLGGKALDTISWQTSDYRGHYIRKAVAEKMRTEDEMYLKYWDCDVYANVWFSVQAFLMTITPENRKHWTREILFPTLGYSLLDSLSMMHPMISSYREGEIKVDEFDPPDGFLGTIPRDLVESPGSDPAALVRTNSVAPSAPPA